MGLRWSVSNAHLPLSVLQEVGMPADYVNKLARMFQDIKVSEDLNQEFKEAHRNNNEGLAGIFSSDFCHERDLIVFWVLDVRHKRNIWCNAALRSHLPVTTCSLVFVVF